MIREALNKSKQAKPVRKLKKKKLIPKYYIDSRRFAAQKNTKI